MVRRYVGPGLHRQHGEGFADIFVGPPDSRDAEPGLALLGEQPLILPLLLLVLGISELVEAVGDDEATPCRELPTVRTEIVDGLPVRPRPAPSALHEVARAALTVDRPDDRRRIGDLDVVTRLDVGRALREADLDLEVCEILQDRRRLHLQSIVVAHAALPTPGMDCIEVLFLICSRT